MQIRARGGNCQCIHRHHGGLHTFTLQANNSHIPCRAPAVLRPCRSESGFSRPWHSTTGARHGHGMGTAWHVWINFGRLSTACGLPAQALLLPATTQTVMKVVNQSATAFWICLVVLMTMETADYKEYELNLRFKFSLSSVVMLVFICILLLILCGQQLFKVFKFRNTNSKIL